MTDRFDVGARPRPYLLPRLRVAGDLLRFESCPLRYRLHGVAGWPEADAEAAPRLAGTLVHAALDHAGTACRPRNAGGEGLPIDDDAASRALASARRLVDALSPRAGRSDALHASLDAAAAIARRTILDLGPYLFPHLTATEQRLAATRLHLDASIGEDGDRRRLRNVERFEVSGVLDAAASGLLPDPDGGPFESLIHGALNRPIERPVGAVIDYKLARRPRHAEQGRSKPDTGAVSLEAHAFQVAAYACIRDRFAVNDVLVGVVIYLYDLFPELDPRAGNADAPDVAVGEGRPVDGVDLPSHDARSISARLHRASAVVVIDEAAVSEATARIDHIGAAIEACAEREAASLPPRLAWPTRRSEICGECDVRPMCPEWQDAEGDGARSQYPQGYGQGEPDDS